eukprot:m.127246 g.127246  ORF g.127246 m.127246 type:complete len:608 (+) comp19849_c0_seq3:67-1890(+)
MAAKAMRTRALDGSRPLPIYGEHEEPDIMENSVPATVKQQTASNTGMEKEEEEEVHIQQLLTAAHSTAVIPTPEANIVSSIYDTVVPANWTQPKQYIRYNPYSLLEEQPAYDMDSDDEAFVASFNAAHERQLTALQFETMMDRLEKQQLQSGITTNELGTLLEADDLLCAALYTHFTAKTAHIGEPTVTPRLKAEGTDVAASARDPYVAFRRRMEKMQTRKNRKNDETGFMHMLKLRRDFDRVRSLLELIKMREKMKRDLMHTELEIHQKRMNLQDWDGTLMQQCAPRTRTGATLNQDRPPLTMTLKTKIKDKTLRRKKREDHTGASSIPIAGKKLHPVGPQPVPMQAVDECAETSAVTDEEFDEDDNFRLRRRKGVWYHAPLPEVMGTQNIESRYHCARRLLLHSTEDVYDLPRPILRGFCRRRVGRGGRVFIDRVSLQHDVYGELAVCTPEQELRAQEVRMLRQLQAQRRPAPVLLRRHAALLYQPSDGDDGDDENEDEDEDEDDDESGDGDGDRVAVTWPHYMALDGRDPLAWTLPQPPSPLPSPPASHSGAKLRPPAAAFAAASAAAAADGMELDGGGQSAEDGYGSGTVLPAALPAALPASA